MLNNLGMMAGTAALAATLGLGAATPALAQDGATPNQIRWLEEGVRGKQAGDFVVGLGAIGVLPHNGGSVPVLGGTPTATNAATPQLDFTYFFTPNIAANLIAATSRHDVSVQGSIIGPVNLGRVWALPPTLTLQYHPLPRSRFSPYAGLGINLTIFYGEGGATSAAVTNVKVGNTVGMAVNFGADWEVAPNWLINFDVKKILFMEPTVRVDTVIGRINATADLNPWVIGASVRYRF